MVTLQLIRTERRAGLQELACSPGGVPGLSQQKFLQVGHGGNYKLAGRGEDRERYLYSPIFLMYSATGASTNRAKDLPAAAAARIAVAEAG